MTHHTVTLELPEEIYEHLKQAADDLRQPLETILIQAVQAGLPPSVGDLPPEDREEFAAMARLSDEKLWEIACSSLSASKQRQLSHLLRKEQEGTLMGTGEERRKLEALHQEVNWITLRKAHAYALLKWRNRRVPTVAELHRE